MNLKEKTIIKLVGIFILIFGLSIIFFDIKSGYKSLGVYLIPLIFVFVGLFCLFKESIVKWFKAIIIKEKIEKKDKFISFSLPLSIISLIGFVAFFFAIRFPENIPVYGWIIIALFIFLPLIMIYGLAFGFSISEKRRNQIEERRKTMFSDNKGITIEMPLFDKNCFISWESIDAIIYYNYIVNSDFIEHHEGYKLYLNTIPIYTKYEKKWWLNKLFPKDSNRKIIDVDKETKHFFEIPKIIEKYLKLNVDINFKDPTKSALISSKTHKNNNKITTIKKWKSNKTTEDQIVYDKFNRSLDEIKKSYR